MTLTLAPKRVAIVLGIGAAIMVLDHLIGWIWAFYTPGLHNFPLVHLDYESNIPTWFNASLLLIGAMSASVNGFLQGQQTRRWLTLAVIFLYLSLDEAARLHEHLSHPIRRLIDFPPYFAKRTWIFAGVLVVAVFVISFLPFLRRLPVRTRRLLLLAGALYVTGAAGFDLLGGAVKYELHGKASIWYNLVSMAEEGSEMFGAVIFIYGALDHAAGRHGKLRITVDRPATG